MTEPVNPAVKPQAIEQPPAAEQDWRQRLLKANLSLPTGRVRSTKKAAPARTIAAAPVEVAPAHSRNAEYLSVKGSLHSQLLDELDRRNLLAASEETLTTFVRTFVDEALRAEDLPLNEDERRRLVGDLLEETLGVGPLASLMADPAVTDILVNRPEQVYVERFGRLEKTDVRFRDVDHLVRIIQRIAARVGRRIDESSPMVNARLPDGSRVNATLPPVTLDSPTLSIRRFGRQRLKRVDLMRLGMFSPDVHDFLEAVVRGRKNIVISGGTGSGKSTLLGALAEAIPDRERIVTIEDSAELILDQEHVVRMETRPENIEGRGLITARDLVVNALRMRPDRIIVGEVRSGEALDMLQAMNTGHDGGLTTVHANSPRDALARLETMVLMAGLDLPSPRFASRSFRPCIWSSTCGGSRTACGGWRASRRSWAWRAIRRNCRTFSVSSAAACGGGRLPASSSPRASSPASWTSCTSGESRSQGACFRRANRGSTRAPGLRNNWKSEIRNPKSETNRKCKRRKHNSKHAVLRFKICNLRFVSDFEFRISDFGFASNALNHDGYVNICRSASVSGRARRLLAQRGSEDWPASAWSVRWRPELRKPLRFPGPDPTLCGTASRLGCSRLSWRCCCTSSSAGPHPS